MTFQAVACLSNQRALCIGEISTKEAQIAIGDDPSFDGHGIYLVSVDSRQPSKPGVVLAKFASEHAASVLANFFRMHGHLEPA